MRLLLGLGGNIGDPEEAFRSALLTLGREHRVLAVASLYRTRPIGPQQANFLNSAAVLDLGCPPSWFLESCRRLESDASRDRAGEERWGPRTLDLDLLLAESLVCRGPTLTLPHPRLHERRFALEPAAEVAPDWTHPFLGRSISDLANDARDRDPDAILEVLSFEF